MPALNDLVARRELRPFESLTLTDQQFLTGEKNGKAVTLAGELRLPPGASDRLPAVILVHGSGGTGSREVGLGMSANDPLQTHRLQASAYAIASQHWQVPVYPPKGAPRICQSLLELQCF